MRRLVGWLAVVVLMTACNDDSLSTEWYDIEACHKPFVRWWWLGSAVDEEGLTYNLEEFAAKGLGGVEITPIYGVKGNEANDVEYLSDRWMELLRHTMEEGKRLDLQIDMNNGTGWPFGGPTVSWEQSTAKYIIDKYTLSAGQTLSQKLLPKDERQWGISTLQRVMASDGSRMEDITSRVTADTLLDWSPEVGDWSVYLLFSGRTRKKVERAAPGGEGLIINHYDKRELMRYLSRFDEAFARSGNEWPHDFFNDSFEAEGSSWDDRFLDLFVERYGYRLENYVDVLLQERWDEEASQVLTDYRALISDLLLENFTQPWTEWANSHGVRTRNQAHGSPGNLIDLYAAVDVPECETYGQSHYAIDGIYRDGISRPNDGDLASLKFASSAAHLTGKRQTSAESLTWLTEHFRTSLALCKPEVDLLMASGVNHICFHGAPYSPKNAEFPAWKFYATVNMSPTNTLWNDAEALFEYVARCQSFLSAGEPDSDFLLYFPVYDIWAEEQRRPFVMFDIHHMERVMPHFKESARALFAQGYDADYISDAFVRELEVTRDGRLRTQAGTTYHSLILPACRLMPHETMEALASLAEQGAQLIFMERMPEGVPGRYDREQRGEAFANALRRLKATDNYQIGADYGQLQALTAVAPETFRQSDGHLMMRRKNEVDGYNYFLAHLTSGPFDGWVELATEAKAVALFDPMTGRRGWAKIEQLDGATRVRLQLPSGGSMLLKTFGRKPRAEAEDWIYYAPKNERVALTNGWSISFPETAPAIEGEFMTDTLTQWCALPVEAATETNGTGRYSVTFTKPQTTADEWLLSLGDVRASARVWLNGEEVGIAWAAPFTLPVGTYLQEGENLLEIDVTNLPANRIAAMERAGIEWRIFKDTNINSVIHRKPFSFAGWAVEPSGLNSKVELIPLQKIDE